MSTRTLYLIIYPGQPGQRAHFSIWAAYAENGTKGTLIHVVGSPMTGFMLEFKRLYDPSQTQRGVIKVAIGSVHDQHVYQYKGTATQDDTPRGTLEQIASQVPAPRASANFRAPVNDTTNRRCQEWTMDYVRKLVANRILHEAAIGIVQSRRDAPHVGITLRPVAALAAQPQATTQASQQQASAQGSQQQATTAETKWEWDEAYKKYRYWNGSSWIWQQ